MSEQHPDSENNTSTMSWAKKLLTAGVGTFFLTEEALKTLVAEFKFPKEMVSTILDGAKGVRNEFMQNVVQEMMSRIQDKVDPAQFLSEFLQKNEVTFEVKVKVSPKDSGESVE